MALELHNESGLKRCSEPKMPYSLYRSRWGYGTLILPIGRQPWKEWEMFVDPIYLNAIIEANKLGARGIQVIGAEMPSSALDDYRIKLFITTPIIGTACEKQWFE